MKMNNKCRSINAFSLLLDANYNLNKREDKMNDDSVMITHPLVFIDFSHGHRGGLNGPSKRAEKYYRYIHRRRNHIK